MARKSIEEVRCIARARWGFASPFRVGIIVGQEGLTMDLPADRTPNWLRLFHEGVKVGAGLREAP